MEIKQLIIYIILLVIAIIFSAIEQSIRKNHATEQAKAIVDVINLLAPDAVIAVEKLGLDKKLSGSEKMAQAVKFVQSELDKLGFTQADYQTIKNAIEKHWADLSTAGLLDVYAPETPETVVNQFGTSTGTSADSKGANSEETSKSN